MIEDDESFLVVMMIIIIIKIRVIDKKQRMTKTNIKVGHHAINHQQKSKG